MNKERYVSYEIAKLLKEKGFNEKTLYHYTNCDVLQHNIVYNKYKNSEMLNAYSAPTQQMTQRWLREEHKIHITTEPLEMFKQERIVYEPIIYLLNDFDDFALEYKTVHLKECDTNEDAIEVALEYTLTKLI